MRAGGADHHRKLPLHARALRGGAPLAQAMNCEEPLDWAKGDQVLLLHAMGGWGYLMQAKGSRGLNVTWCLLHDIEVVGMDQGSHLVGQREVCPDTTGACEWASPAAPVTSRVGKKKKRSLQPSNTCYCSHSPGNITVVLLPLPMLWAEPKHLITVPSQDRATRSSWCSTTCMG